MATTVHYLTVVHYEYLLSIWSLLFEHEGRQTQTLLSSSKRQLLAYANFSDVNVAHKFREVMLNEGVEYIWG